MAEQHTAALQAASSVKRGVSRRRRAWGCKRRQRRKRAQRAPAHLLLEAALVLEILLRGLDNFRLQVLAGANERESQARCGELAGAAAGRASPQASSRPAVQKLLPWGRSSCRPAHLIVCPCVLQLCAGLLILLLRLRQLQAVSGTAGGRAVRGRRGAATLVACPPSHPGQTPAPAHLCLQLRHLAHQVARLLRGNPPGPSAFSPAINSADQPMARLLEQSGAQPRT